MFKAIVNLVLLVSTDISELLCLALGSVVEDVEKCVCKRSLNNWYEARLVPVRPNERGRRVYCYLTPRVRACSATTGPQSVYLRMLCVRLLEVKKDFHTDELLSCAACDETLLCVLCLVSNS